MSEVDHPEVIPRLLQGVYPSFALLAGLELDLFTSLAEGPATTDELAGRLGVDATRLELLLNALVVAGLLERSADRFDNTAEAARFLARGSPDFVGDAHVALATMWRAALGTAESIRSGVPQAPIDFASMSSEELAAFYHGFQNEARLAGIELARREDFSRCRRLADVGGGAGGLALAVARAWPELRVTVIDLPRVVPITRAAIEPSDVADRVDAVGADVVAQPVPGSYDVAVLRALIQVLGPEEARQAIAHVAAALEPGGEILILGRILDDSRLAPVASVMSNLVFLNVFEAGRAYTEAEHRAWLEEAGLGDVRRESLPGGREMIRARKEHPR